MLDAKDLRIGNYLNKNLKSGNGRTLTDKIGCQDIVRIYQNTGSINYEPIELTEEWLLRFGFERHELDNWFYLKIINDWTRLNININGSVCELSISNHGAVINVAYVHQLQNLYYALTQKELTLKEIPANND